ncbi:YPDG domain-containing protein [uncultured Actinomyces sp.]|uniref:YPDG domain-containing protein n=1 Tax=uncultured Actinomyces sp. TaxID=249061 RepID=UPI00280530AC|nr:YPDG domain-containing protein [uncultured Actinomyces sp.]
MTPGYFLGGLDHAVAQPVAPAQVSGPTTQVIDADMIASGRVTKAANLTDAHGVGKGLISGHVYLTGPNGNPGAAYDNGNIKLDDITVYAQFRDKDGSYSPIFSAKTHTLPDVLGGNGGQGTFAFGTGDKGITWTDKLGRKHTWAARTDQKHRIWVEPFINDRGSRVEMFRQANGWTPGSFNGVVEGPMGSFVAADGNMQLMAAFLREIPPSHETSWMAAKGDKLVEDPKGPDKAAALQGPESNMLSGQVWLETGGSPDWGFPATGPKKESKDPGAAGYTVFASTLTREGAAANAALHAQYKDDPNKLAEATKKMLEDNPEYILKTVYGKTDAEGNYSLRFGDYTDANQTREDFLNPDHVFVWVENKDGVVQTGYTGFHTPIFQRFNGGGNFRPADAVPAENQVKTALVSDIGNPRYGKPLNKIYNVRHALIPYAPVTITADYNATDKPAAPGTTVTPEFHGTLSPLPSKIEWRDGKGKVVKTCDLDQSKGTKAQVSACTFDIPKDAKKGDVFSVVVVSGISDVAAWTVLVTKDADDYEPEYEGKLVVPGQETKSSPSFTDKDGKGVDVPEGSKFSIGDYKAPEGYVVTIDENTGEITVTFPDGSKLNKDTVEEFDVPVTVTYKDGSTDEVKANFKLDTDGDGDPDVTDPDDDNDGIPDEDDSNPKVPNQNTIFEPGYEDGSGKPGEDVTVPAPEFKDKDGKTVTPPEGTKFTPGENVPDGVTIDENTGEITVTIPEDAKPGDKIEVPVVVTYPDGSTDEVTVTITVTEKDATPVTPGEPTERNPSLGASADDPADCEMPPFVTVEKTEGVEYKVTVDGKELTPDAEGKYVYDYGQTVKVEASPAKGFTFPEGVTTTWTYTTAQNEVCNVPETKDNEKYEPEYEDGTGKPGDDVTVDKPIFKDGDGNEVTPPEGTTFTPGEGTPDGVTVNEDGSIKVTIPEDAKPGDKITVPVVVTYPDDSTDTVEVTVTVEQPDTKTPDWKDGSGEPGGKVVIPNDGGPVDDGTTVETDGPGKAEIDGDGNLVVDIDDNAKPGDKIVVIVKDKDGNEIDRVTVTVEKPAAGDNTGETTEKVVQKPKLARTGVQVAGLAGIAAAMGVAGLGLAFMRRRREGEEN